MTYPFTSNIYPCTAPGRVPLKGRGSELASGKNLVRSGSYRGFGIAEDMRDLYMMLAAGGSPAGPNMAFDLPTQLGYDSDHPYDEKKMATAEERQLANLKEVKRERDNSKVTKCLKQVEDAARDNSVNMIHPILEAVKAYASLGEICGLLRQVWGEYNPSVYALTGKRGGNVEDYYSTFKHYVDNEKIRQKQAVFFKGQATTYGELIEEADRVALALTSRGTRKGEIIAFWMGNCVQVLPIFLGIVKCGAIAEPINVLLTEYEVKPQLEITKPRVLFISPDKLPMVERIRPHLSELRDVVVVSGETSRDALSYKEFIRNAEGQQPEVDISVDDEIIIFFTSGTTGAPKGVVLTHKNLLAVIQGQLNRFAPLGEMVTLCSVPLSHIFGLNTLTFAALMRRWCVILQEWFETNETARLIETYRISSVSGVPTMVQSLVDVADQYDMRSLRLVLCGAAPVPQELYHKVEKALNCQMLEGWGLTEGSGNATVTPPGMRKIGSCGIPFENIGLECAIMDDDDNLLPPGEVGELVMRGSLNMKEYLGNPQATAEVLKNGWLHTGDLARMDEDGYFYIVDRKKDIIIRGGFNVYPAEVEAALYNHPAIKEAAVFGISDSRKGETVAASIMLKPGHQVTEEEIIALCQERLARYKVPKCVKIRQEALPKSSTGKILRRVLRKEFEEEIKK